MIASVLDCSDPFRNRRCLAF